MAQVSTISLTYDQEEFVNSEEQEDSKLFLELRLMDPVEGRGGNLSGLSYTPLHGDRLWHCNTGRGLNKGLRLRPEVRIHPDKGLQWCQPIPLSIRLEEGTLFYRLEKTWSNASLRMIIPRDMLPLGPAGPQTWEEVYPLRVPTGEDIDHIREHGFIDSLPSNQKSRFYPNDLKGEGKRYDGFLTSLESISIGDNQWDSEWDDPRCKYLVVHEHSLPFQEGAEAPRQFRMTLGKFLIRAEWPESTIDYAYEKLWLKIGEIIGSSTGTSLTEVRGHDIVTAYEDAVGDKSCMTERPEWTHFYACHPDRISMAISTHDRGDGGARCILWHTPNGYVIHDRIYANNSYPGVLKRMLKDKYGDRLLAAWDNDDVLSAAGLPTSLAISNCIMLDMKLPDNNSLPYLDNAKYRWHAGKTNKSVDILPLGCAWRSWANDEGFGGQASYTGGPLVDDECICDECNESCDEDDRIHCSDGEWRCESCTEDSWVYVEGHSEYQSMDDVCLCNDGEWCIQDECFHIPDEDEWVHEDHIEEYIQDMVSSLLCRVGTDTVLELLSRKVN
jgi:hypothetical protein